MKEIKEQVNHPSHYNQGGIECIDAIQAMVSNWEDPWLASNAFQVVKYIWRCPFKENTVQDLEKAKFYLNKMIDYCVEKESVPKVSLVDANLNAISSISNDKSATYYASNS